MYPVCFTPESARNALHRVRPIAVTLCRLYAVLERRHATTARSGDQPVDPSYFRTLVEFQLCRRELRQLGARVRDAKQGLFGFPARRDGRPVWICWRLGEPSSRFWLEGDSGPATGLCTAEEGLRNL